MAQMLFNSGPLLAVIIIDMAALLMYNFSGMCVTGERAGPATPVLDTDRPSGCRAPLHVTEGPFRGDMLFEDSRSSNGKQRPRM